mgnify:CR=1 FL=1
MPSGERAHTFLFADLAGFTALTEAHGDEEAADLVADFSECARRHLQDTDVEEVKLIGDALMLRGEEATVAIRVAIGLRGEIEGRTSFPGLRIGMHTGAAVERNGDWFGSTVNTAARVAALASSGEIVLTEATHDAAGDADGIEFESLGRQRLRNISEPVRLFRASLATESSSEGWPVDPVCQMAVDPRRAAGSLHHGERVFQFCSLECAGRFAARPEAYVQGPRS